MEDIIKIKREPRNVQIVTCNCGNIIAGCIEPDCYTDKKWLKSIRNFSLMGYKVSIAKSNTIEISKCTCK
jgi:hypothetical protein